MKNQLKNKTIWITGASRGIGLAIAKSFKNSEANLALSSIRKTTPEIVSSEFKDYSNIIFLPCDISSEKEVYKVHEKINSTFGKVDILINNAGVTKFDSFYSSTIEDFDKIIGVNLRGTFNCTKAVLENMLKKNNGIILNIISVAAIKIFKNSALYAASKAGVLAMSRVLREEVRKNGIKVIDILPVATETEIWSQDALDKYAEKMMKPGDVASVVYDAIIQCLNGRLMIEEIILRPQDGDL